MSHPALGPTTNVLVTGVTGLIGGEIVRGLTRAGLGRVAALVRPLGGVDPGSRLLERMRRSGDPAAADLASRVEVIPGDVSRPCWGLSDEDLARVTRGVDLIIHCAADTSFLCRRTVQDTNVAGIRYLIDLARRCGRRPLLVYMSTATNGGKASHRCLREEDGCRPDNEHHNDYTRSKAVAEDLLRASGLRVLTLRPTIVFSAGLPDPDFAQNILWFVPLLRQFDCLPMDPASRLDLVPVGYVAEATIDLLRKPALAHDCYHLSAGERHCTTVGALNEFVNRYYRRRPLRLVPPSAWTREHFRAHVCTDRQRKIFFGLRYYLPFLNMDVVYDNRRLTGELGDQASRLPPMTEYMGGLLKLIRARRALCEVARP